MQELSWSEWDAKAQYRCLHYKFKEQLTWLKDFYPEKIDRLQRRLDDILTGHEPSTKEEILFLKEKIFRLTDKFQTTLKEIEGRKLGHFKNRPEHGTLYYIDLDGGNNGDDGLGTGTAWLTLLKYVKTTVRTAGDIAKVRANTTEVMGAHLVIDEDGDEDSLIEIRGCSIADDPWSDGTDVKPSLSFGDGGFQINMADDQFWKLNRLVVKEGTVGDWGLIRLEYGYNYFLDCEVTDCPGGNDAAVRVVGANPLFENCIFKDNLKYNFYGKYAKARLINCTFDGGATTTDYGIYAIMNSEIEAIDCDFGQNTSHDVADIAVDTGAIVKTRNVKLDVVVVSLGWGAVVFSEDDDATYNAELITEYHGTITKDTGIKTGNANFSNKMEPNTNCGVNNPLTLSHDSLIEFPFNPKCLANTQKTVTVKIRSLGTWGTYPTAAELYIEFSYLDHAVNATRTKIASTQVLSHASNWVSFTVTFTPLQTGIAYGAVYLKKFEAGKGCYVNGEVT